jgi:hypothetical protein
VANVDWLAQDVNVFWLKPERLKRKHEKNRTPNGSLQIAVIRGCLDEPGLPGWLA